MQFISPCTEIVAEYTFSFCLTFYVQINFRNLAGQLFWCFPSYLLESKAVGAVGLFLLINEGRGSDRYSDAGGGGPVRIMQGSFCFIFQSEFQNDDFIRKFETLMAETLVLEFAWTSDHHRFIEILGKTQIFTIDKD